MTDDDRTVDADASTMDDLRRMAEDSRNTAEGAEIRDTTVQADESTMDELRRFAEEARLNAQPAPEPASSPPVADHTVDADEQTMAALRSYATEARTSAPAAAPDVRLDIPPAPARPQPGERRSSPGDGLPSVPDLRTPERPMRISTASGQETTDRAVHRSNHDADVASIRPPTTESGGAWRPPARMVMPTEPERTAPAHHGPWRTVSIVLGAALAMLLAFVAFSFVTGDDEVPADDSVPTNSELREVDEGGRSG